MIKKSFFKKDFLSENKKSFPKVKINKDAIAVFSQYMDSWNYGLKEDFSYRPAIVKNGKKEIAGPRWQNIQKNIINLFNRGKKSWLHNNIPKYIYSLHYQSIETLYYCNHIDANGIELSLMVDVDCHKEGSKEGADNYISDLRSLSGLETLYCEDSTNGKGNHAYLNVVVDCNDAFMFSNGKRKTKLQLTLDIKVLIKRLEVAFDNFCKNNNHDVEMVEIKGAPAEYYFKNNRLDSIVNGSLAKVPRKIFGPNGSDLKAFQKTSSFNIESIIDLINRLEIQNIIIIAPKVRRSKVQDRATFPCGSNSFNPENITSERIKTAENNLKYIEFNRNRAECVKKKVISMQDRAVFHLILVDAKEQNFPLSNKIIGNIWGLLFSTGLVNHAFDTSRLAAIRNDFIDLGLLNGNSSYIPPNTTDENGNNVKTKSVQTYFNDDFSSLLQKKEGQDHLRKELFLNEFSSLTKNYSMQYPHIDNRYVNVVYWVKDYELWAA